MNNIKQIGNNTDKSSRYSFRKGWMKVTLGDKDTVKREIQDVFGSYSRPFWADILYGRKALTLDQMDAITAVFVKHGIKKSQIFGS